MCVFRSNPDDNRIDSADNNCADNVLYLHDHYAANRLVRHILQSLREDNITDFAIIARFKDKSTTHCWFTTNSSYRVLGMVYYLASGICDYIKQFREEDN